MIAQNQVWILDRIFWYRIIEVFKNIFIRVEAFFAFTQCGAELQDKKKATLFVFAPDNMQLLIHSCNSTMNFFFLLQNQYFSQHLEKELHKTSYYIKRIVRPHYVAVITNNNAINQFSLANNNFNMPYAVWLVLFIYKGHNFDYCYNPPGNIFHLEFNTEMLVRCGTENILREWYSIYKNRTEINDFAHWSLEKGIVKMVSDSLYDRRYSLQGLVMRTVIVKDSPFINLNENGQLDGMFGRILTELCVTLNCSFKIVSEVNEHGSWNAKKNTWSGAIGELYVGRADISISDFSMTSARLNVVDFTFPLLLSKNFLYIKEPKIFAIKWSSYFLTFSHSIWIAIFGLLVFTTVLLIFLKIKNQTDRNIGHLLSDNFLEIWGIFCQQGLPGLIKYYTIFDQYNTLFLIIILREKYNFWILDFPQRLSLRITYFSIFLLAVILSAAYSAALISFLTSVIHVLPFRSLENFVEDDSYQFIVIRGTADYDIFANSADPLAKTLMKLMPEEEKLPITVLEGFRSICKNRKQAIYTSDEIKKVLNFKIPCNVVSIETGRIDSLSIILSKHNPFIGIINFHLQKFFNNGIMNRLKDVTFKKNFNDMMQQQPVQIVSIISPIFLILIGIILSIFILIIEKYIFIRKKKKMSMVKRISLFNSLEFYIERKKTLKNIAKDKRNRRCTRVNYS
ncbi:glutamate receptor ionotropic, delta-2-like isoform X2 [Vespa crabro]|uniref:glutamate receptor ionotropic, delta-2-like isoform X2 n=1 Tax=Vespa crabro TaxID=7445 RepID=UPI001F0264FE|nr:glutamate receptor ionotropic, delta-2-like isoform X2 [Vespa crabro]